MEDQFERTRKIFGEDAMKRLSASTVAVFGVGGVGGYVAEALARSGIGHIVLVDKDEVSLTNLNRQIIALHSTLGKPKVQVMKERILDINPDAAVDAFQCFFLPENADTFDFSSYDFVVDAVDTVSAKIELILRSQAAGTPVISSMGAGNKTNPALFEVADIYKTSVCPLARVMRHELKKRGVRKCKVVYSKEMPVVPKTDGSESGVVPKKPVPGSTAFVPSAAGLLIASEVVRCLAQY
ncbi:MAG: tRNA threonylcarbamoyladenosine dehydratase [Treponemataceae bacterium]|nr:tRNA threonylcarbamoyladenosine dehydratase [Treponemataceae bacterium]